MQTMRYYAMKGMYAIISRLNNGSGIAAYKKITSHRTYAVVCVVYSLFAFSFGVVMTIIQDTGTIDYETAAIAINAWGSVFLVVPFLIVFVAFAIDCLLFCVKRRNSLYEYFVEQDPLRFRSEMSFLIASFVFLVFYQTMLFVANPRVSPVAWAVVFALARFTEFVIWLWAFGGFVCAYALWDMLRSGKVCLFVATDTQLSVRHASCHAEDTMLYRVLQDVPDGYELFRDYCKLEFSSENLIAWSRVRALLHEWPSMDREKRACEFEAVYETYLSPDSDLEINVQNVIRHQFLSALGRAPETPGRKHTDRSPDQLQLDALEAFGKSIVENLSDTFSRLSETRRFKTYASAVEARQQIVDRANMCT